MTSAFNQVKDRKKKAGEVDKKFDEWAESITGWKLAKWGLYTVLGTVAVLFVLGLVVGLPLWGLYKLFFVVLP